MNTIISVILVSLIILAIIGLGWQAFFSGVASGAKQITNSTKNAAYEAQEYVSHLVAGNATKT